ncbi:Glucose dehydrogenase [FAD, quinone], partial [Orchesella cincta]
MRDRFQSKLQNDTDTFDFIVVGCGSAGSVIANRLSQYYSVLLLEAGSEPHPFQAVPGLAFFMPNHPEIDWMHRSVPQKRAFGNSLKREASLSVGKGLGGSGNLNFLNYLRGSPLDYENWRNISGDKSWGYREMRKYFQLVEDYSKDTTQNMNGTLKIDIPDFVGLSEEFITAGQELGFKHVDLNDNFVEGFDVNYFPIHNGVRQAPYQSYLKTARNRKSLTIRKFAHVNRILFRDDDTNQVTGVEYERHGELKVVKATKEVILSAGALSTPKILLLSGIGPAQHLQDVGIPLRLDLPVGKNLQDHFSTLVGPFFINESRSLLIGKDIDTRAFLEWGLNGKGPLTSSFYQASALIQSSFAKTRAEDKDWPDIHLQLSSIGIHKTYAQDLAHAYNLQENLLSQYYGHAGGKQGFSISVSNGRPVARGEVLLSGRDPKDKLMINPKYLEDSYGLDVNIMRDGIQTALKLAENSTAFQKLGARFTDKRLPGCEHVKFRSDAYWECYIRQFSLSMQAFCGTAAMGKSTSKFAVVDPELKVIGAKGLRVIDASIMPSIVVGSPQAAVLAIGEKGAESILQYWRQFDVPSKVNQDLKQRGVGEFEGKDTPDSFSGFAFIGKATNNGKQQGSRSERPRQKLLKQKQKINNPVSVNPKNLRSTPPPSTTTTTTTTTAPVQKSDFEQAETRFSHNLNTIMEFLRNSRAINEAIDDETYNDLVQNFGDRIVEIMKRNKTDIFFIPVTTTTTTSTTTSRPVETTKSSKTVTTKRPSVAPVSKNNNFGGAITSFQKFNLGKPASSPSSSKSQSKTHSPSQFPTTLKPRSPSPSKVTTIATRLSTYFLSNTVTPKVKVTTTVPKKVQQPSTLPSFGGKGTPSPKYSPLVSSHKSTPTPKKLGITTITTKTPSSTIKTSTARITTTSELPGTTFDPEEFEEVEVEDPTDETPLEESPAEKKPTKVVELILNHDLSINQTLEVESSSSNKKDNRKLIEYKTEELRPFPEYPPYKIFPVPGREFLSSGLVSQNLPPLILSQSSSSGFSGGGGLTPPPEVISSRDITDSLQLPIPQFQQAQIIPPPKLPPIIDDNVPIQTAKTIM